MDRQPEPSSESEVSRRGFLVEAGAVGAGVAATSAAAKSAGAAGDSPAGEVPTRPFGRTGARVSILGIGGSALGDVKDDAEAVRIVRKAVDAGITFMDNAWEYHDGRAEELMGKTLKGLRDRVFLMTKVCTHGRDAKVAMQQLEQSLKRLRTDHLDLWQIHEVVYDNDPDLHFAKGGVVEALDAAKKQGKVRFVGFTGHKHPDIFKKMLAHNYPFDSCQMPLNAFDATYRSFASEILPELNRRGIAPIGMKSLGGSGDAVRKGAVTVEEALRYVLSLPIATLVSGIDSMEVLDQNLDIVRRFTPMREAEMKALRQKCAKFAGDGRFELYKSSMKFDGPIGRAQHGYESKDRLSS